MNPTRSKAFLLVLSALTMTTWPTLSQAQSSQVISLKIDGTCAAPFELKAGASSCTVDAVALAQLNSKEKCEAAPGTTWTPATAASPAACAAAAEKSTWPAVSCGTTLDDLQWDTSSKSCVIVRKTPTSTLSDYVGDCFQQMSEPVAGSGLPSRKEHRYLLVESQRSVSGGDKELVVAPAKSVGPLDATWGCRENGGKQLKVKASDLVLSGAHRYGWTYGVLSVPFKYYPGADTRLTTTANIGPFLGRRWGQAGSAITLALSATIGSVRGEATDSNGNVTGTPDIMSFGIATGLMMDVSKNPDLKPFKLGLFVGQERANTTKDISFPNQGKWWWAFQIGYDFTDAR